MQKEHSNNGQSRAFRRNRTCCVVRTRLLSITGRFSASGSKRGSPVVCVTADTSKMRLGEPLCWIHAYRMSLSASARHRNYDAMSSDSSGCESIGDLVSDSNCDWNRAHFAMSSLIHSSSRNFSSSNCLRKSKSGIFGEAKAIFRLKSDGKSWNLRSVDS